MTWQKISKNPVDPEVHKYLLNELMTKREVDGRCSAHRIEEFVKGQIVLDVGVVEHDLSHIQSNQWKHKKIKEWSKKLLALTY